MKTNLQNTSDSPNRNLIHQHGVTDASAGRPAGVSTSEPSHDGRNVNIPRWPRRFAHWLRSAALFALAVFWQTAALLSQDFRYTIISGDQVTITGYAGPGGDVTIPETIQGLPVTRIGNSAFSGLANLTSVSIPNTVTRIGPDAFGYCFGLASVTIGNSVTSIGDQAFRYCGRLTSVTIGDSVSNIGLEAFYGCSSLTNVTLPNSVRGIGDFAFYYCTSLPNVTIPNGVRSIGVNTFGNCTSLANVTIPNSVTSIGYDAFINCASLASVSIPDSVTSIDGQAFFGCTSLVSILVDAANPNYSSLDGVLFNKSQTFLIQFPNSKSGEYMVPNTVTKLAEAAFSGCTRLTSATIPQQCDQHR